MNDEKLQEMITEMLREAMAEANSDFPMPKPKKKVAAACGCEEECGDISSHSEDTVLVGCVLDPMSY